MKFKPEFLEYIQTILPATCSLDEFMQLCQTPLRRSIRVNTLKISVDAFVARMTAKGWKLKPIPWCATGFWLEREDETKPLGNTIEHLAGLFYVQEASSMLPPEALFLRIHHGNWCWTWLQHQAQNHPDSSTYGQSRLPRSE